MKRKAFILTITGLLLVSGLFFGGCYNGVSGLFEEEEAKDVKPPPEEGTGPDNAILLVPNEWITDDGYIKPDIGEKWFYIELFFQAHVSITAQDSKFPSSPYTCDILASLFTSSMYPLFAREDLGTSVEKIRDLPAGKYFIRIEPFNPGTLTDESNTFSLRVSY